MPEGNGILKAQHYTVTRYKQGCHPRSGMSATFVPDLKLMILRCMLCNSEVLRFEVADKFSTGATDGGNSAGTVKLAD